MQELIINLPINNTVATEIVIDCRHQIVPEGKGRLDKQMYVMGAGLTGNTMAYAATKAGKVGKLAREQSGAMRVERAATAAAKGNFTLMYEIIVLETAKTIQPIRTTSDYERARGFVAGMYDNLKNGGYTAAGKLTSEASALRAAISMFDMCDEAIAAQKAADFERRSAAKQQLAA